MDIGVALDAVRTASLVNEVFHEVYILLVDLNHIVAWLDFILTRVISTSTGATNISILLRCEVACILLSLPVKLVITGDSIEPAYLIRLLL